MNKSTLVINGEVDMVTQVASPFTHEVPSAFFNDLGNYKVIGTEISQSANTGFFVAKVILESDVFPSVNNLNALLGEYADSKVLLVLESDNEVLLASAEGALAV
jgi:hypothetical protein